MPETDLLRVYATAVQRMRTLQCGTPGDIVTDWIRQLEEAEREVDQLTTLHLLPSLEVLDFMPLLVEGKK